MFDNIGLPDVLFALAIGGALLYLVQNWLAGGKKRGGRPARKGPLPKGGQEKWGKGGEYTAAQVAAHKTEDDCWMVVNGKVLDVTRYAREHPGGARVLVECAGKDASANFNAMHPSDYVDRYAAQAVIGKLSGAPPPAAPAMGKAKAKAQPASTAPGADTVTLWVNGERHDVPRPHPATTLLDHLRETENFGTKLSCGQGGCGACTVVATVGGKERAVNACIRPLLLCDGASVTTTEGLGSAARPHPVQQRIAECHGSQCGFCTPGQVMAMYGLLKAAPAPTASEVELALDGNLCRCTGYRGIHAAFHSLATDDKTVTDVAGRPDFEKAWKPYKPAEDPKVPAAAAAWAPRPLHVVSRDGTTEWVGVATVDGWRKHAADRPVIVSGSTSTGIFGQKGGNITYVDVSGIPRLSRAAAEGSGLRVGAAVTLTDLIALLQRHDAGSGTFAALADGLREVANTNIRNAASWGGNVVMGKAPYFPSDCVTLLSAAGAAVRVATLDGGEAEMPLADFATDFDGEAPYLVLDMFLPKLPGARLAWYRQAMRPVNSISVAHASFRAELADGVVKDPWVQYGAVAMRPVVARRAMEWMSGRRPDEDALAGLIERVREIDVATDATYHTQFKPDGRDAWRRELVASFAFKWFLTLRAQLPAGLARALHDVRDLGTPQAMTSVARLAAPAGHPAAKLVGPKKEAVEQACGETKYTADMPMPAKGLHAAFVVAPTCGKFDGVDAATALGLEGVIEFIGAAGIPGMNSSGLVPGDEFLFVPVGADVQFPGQPVGVVVAHTARQAHAAARAVVVRLSDPATPPIFTLDDALAKDSLLGMSGKKDFEKGDVDAAMARGDVVVVEGDVVIGGQNNWYLEKHTALAEPDEMGRMRVHGGNQCPDWTKTRVMLALGCPSNMVTISSRPMGGGFGGKFSKQFPAFCAAAVACKKLGRPVKLAMSIHQDMGIAGNTRHAGRVHYRAAATKAGKLVALDTTVVVDAGCANDYTDFILDEILKYQDFAYEVPAYRSKLTCVKTNNPSCTAVRAPGLMQALIISETIVDRVAQRLGVAREAVVRASLKPDGAESATDMKGQVMPDWNMQSMFDRLAKEAEFERRDAECAEFNAANRFTKRAVSMMPLKYAASYLFMNGAQATVNVTASDGSVEVRTPTCEMGQGGITKAIGVVAAEFDIDPAKVTCYYADTSVTPNLGTEGASTGTEVMCQAVRLACEELRRRLDPVRVQLTKEWLEEGKEDSRAHLGEPRKAENKGKPPTWEEVCGRAWGSLPTDTRTHLSATSMYTTPGTGKLTPTPVPLPFWLMPDCKPYDFFVTGCAATEVEVDLLTGEVGLRRSDVTIDVGQSINPVLDLGQAEGGFAFGLGSFLREEVLLDPETGRNKSDGSWMYKPPSNKCMPREFNVSLLPGTRAKGNCHYGSKGCGEPPLLLAYSAVSAVKKALAASRAERGLPAEFQLDSPATPDRIHQAAELSAGDLTMQPCAGSSARGQGAVGAESP